MSTDATRIVEAINTRIAHLEARIEKLPLDAEDRWTRLNAKLNELYLLKGTIGTLGL